MKPDFLPESFLSKIAPADRRAIGRPARTASERQADNDVKLERELHKLIWNELLRRGIVPVHSRTDRKTTNAVGLPDFIFSLPPGVPMALEVKLPGNKLTEEQDATRQQMVLNGWRYYVIFSFDEALSAINSITESRQ